jgi:hypothetical protein
MKHNKTVGNCDIVFGERIYPTTTANEWQSKFKEIPYHETTQQIAFIKNLLTTHSAHLVERIEKYAGKVFGFEVIENKDPKNKEYSAGFEAGKKFMKDQAIDIVKNI